MILGNVPSDVAKDLAALLLTLDFRSADIAAGSDEPFEALSEHLEYSVLTSIRGDDFTPPQPGTSYLMSVRRRPSSTE